MRGYLLSGKIEFLAPYINGSKNFYKRVNALRETVKDSPFQVELLNKIETGIRTWQKNVAKPAIALRREIGSAKTMESMHALVGNAQGKTYFDQFRQIMADFRVEENAVMTARQSANTATVNDSYFLITAGIAVALCIGIILAWLTGRTIAIPIKRMTDVMQRLAKGERTVDIPGIGRGDEIGEMAGAVEYFKQTAIEADELRQEQAAQRDDLQEQVDKATHELQFQAQELEVALAKEKELNELQKQFVSMASHEFRTPLAIIDMAAQRLKKKADDVTPEEAVKRADKIRAAVRRMTRLMEDTLTAARMEDGAIKIMIEPCDIGKLVAEVCYNQQEISKTHVISCDLIGPPVTIQADAGSVEQALTNLLSNAVKYAPDAPDIEVKGYAEGDHVVISVRDHGLGIDEDEIDRIGERFFRAKNSTGIEGTGIGLNLVKTLVEMHDGSFGVESKKGEGSTFTIRLPIAGPDLSAQSNARAA